MLQPSQICAISSIEGLTGDFFLNYRYRLKTVVLTEEVRLGLLLTFYLLSRFRFSVDVLRFPVRKFKMLPTGRKKF